jgi:two-component system response regulator
MPSAQIRKVLLIDDDEMDAHLVRFALRRLPFPCQLDRSEDGTQAWQYLSEAVDNGTLPDLIFLDLYMPKMNGFELLAKLRGDERFENLPIIVLTGLDSDASLLEAYNSGATSYVTKPTDRIEFQQFIAQTTEWWIDAA